MSIYNRQIESAKKLIRSKGKLVLWRTFIDNPTTVKWKPEAPTTQDHNVYITFFPIMSVMKEFLRYMKDTDIPVGSIQGYMAAQSFEPSLRDIVISGHEIYNVKNIQKLAPNGDVILYILEFDK